MTEGEGATLAGALLAGVLAETLGDGLAPAHAASSTAAVVRITNVFLPTFTVCLLKPCVVAMGSGVCTTRGESRQGKHGL